MLAKNYPFARRLVNSGRLSVPAILADSPLNTPDRDPDFSCGPGAMVPGAPAADAPVTGPAGAWLLDYVGGDFTLLAFGAAVAPSDVAALARDRVPCKVVQVGGHASAGAATVEDVEGLAARRYDGRPGTVYLLRPDQHVCARWRAFDLPAVRAGDRARDLQRLTRHAMATLITESNHPAPDDFYERLIATHRGLSDEESALVNAKLVLLLANHIGDPGSAGGGDGGRAGGRWQPPPTRAAV